MSQFLVLRLSPEPAWTIVDSAGATLAPVTAGDLPAAAALAVNREVVVLVPGEQVTISEATLPLKGAGRGLQVVAYAMEEQLAQDVENFHFAIGPQAADGRVPVAAVQRAQMESWLQELRAAGIEPSAVYPETTCLPDNPGKIVVLLDSRRLFVRPVAGLPFVLDAEPLSETFGVAGLEGADRHLHCYVSERDWRESQVAIEALRELCGSLEVHLLTDGPLRLLATGAVRHAPWSLLQGDFAARRGSNGRWQRWRLAAALAAGLVVAHLGFEAARLVSVHRAERRLDAAIEQTFRSAMPDVQRIVNARAQMQARLGGGHASGVFLVPLAALAQAVPEVPGASVQSLGWSDGALDLRLRVPAGDDLAMLSQSLGRRGLAVDVRSTTSQGDSVEGKIQLRTPAG